MGRGLRARECKECHRVQRNRYYRKKTKEEKARATRRRQESARWAGEIKRAAGCQICGFDAHPAALEFHHLDPTKKEFVPAVAMRKGWSRDRIFAELDLCTVLCANCHRILHAEDRACGRSSVVEPESSKLRAVGSIPTVRSLLGTVLQPEFGFVQGRTTRRRKVAPRMKAEPGPAKGQRVASAKLRDTDIPVIRGLLRDGISARKVALRYGVAHTTISLIGRNKAWVHVSG